MRKGLNEATIKRYSDNYRIGVKMAPIKLGLVEGVPVLLDGWHRMTAMEQLHLSEAEALVCEMSREEAIWHAAEANLANGLPIKSAEYRNVFRAYIRAKRHYHPDGRLKSYREIAPEIGRTYGTIRNWMEKDFPSIFRLYAKDDDGGEKGGLIDLEGYYPHEETALSALQEAHEAFKCIDDPALRGKLIAAAEDLVSEMKAFGAWDALEY